MSASPSSDPGSVRPLSWGRYTVLAIQLLLATWVIARFQIESRAFGRLSLLVLAGYLVHARLPTRWRQPAFALLSMVGVALVLGAINATWVLLLGGGLIAICQLPIAMRLRIGLIGAAGVALALLRVDLLHAPWSSAIWPVLGSMFMFRLMIYLYDRSHGVAKGSVWETLSYFFLLPNVCFALFPVVDYKTYRRSYESEERWRCHQTGIDWITRGLVHLLLYRWIYHYAVLAPSEVETAVDLTRFVLSNYALYLRVSGTFHLVVGIIRLFGYSLPETNFLYYLSRSVNDFWRRANIYWKDFMTKLFYYPMFFRLRKGGEVRALALSTILVVVVTWALHSYQWFWLRGSFPVRWQDGVFWVAIGLLMIANTLYERGHTRARGRRAGTAGSRDWGAAVRRALSTAAMFTFMSCFWSLWTCESWDSWVAMWSAVGGGRGAEAAIIAGSVLLVLMIASGLPAADAVMKGRPLWQRAALPGVTLVALLLVSTAPVYSRLGSSGSSVVQSLRVAKLNRLDTESLQKGYYEDLQDVDRFNSELWTVFKSRPTSWLELRETKALRPVDDFLLSELVPDSSIEYKGGALEINSQGLRDREYESEKPPGTVRAVMAGASLVMGAGVGNDETFEALVEDRLDESLPGGGGQRFEMLNLSVGGYSPLQRLRALEIKGLGFSPDLTIYVAHENELYRVGRHLVAAKRRDIDVPYEEIRRLLENAGIDRDMADGAFEEKLETVAREILALTYRRFVETSRDNGAVPVWVFLPTLEIRSSPEDVEWLLDMARRAGFEVIDLFSVWDEQDLFSLRVADWDYHPNVAGHRLIAEALGEELAARPELFSVALESSQPNPEGGHDP